MLQHLNNINNSTIYMVSKQLLQGWSTHAHPFYGPLDFVWDYPGEPLPEPIWILLKQETVSGSGISCAICESAPHPS